MNKTKAVYCKNQKEWDFVSKKLGRTDPTEYNKVGNCIVLINPDSSVTHTSNYHEIISFEDWCKENNYTFNLTPILKWKYIVCLDSPNENPNGRGDYKGGRGFKANYCFKVKKKLDLKDHVVFFMENHANGVFNNSVREATKDEIAHYEKVNKPYDIREILSNNPKPKFKVGDVVNTNNKGWQYTKQGINEKYAIGFTKSSSRDNLTITDIIYSDKNKVFWYQFDNNGNYYTEDSLELPTSNIIEEKSVEKWLRETKALNLSLKELESHIDNDTGKTPYEIYELLKGESPLEKSKILHEEWNNSKLSDIKKSIPFDKILEKDISKDNTVNNVQFADITLKKRTKRKKLNIN